MMNPIYTAISWIMLRWHDLWDLILPDGTFLGTTWDWVLAIVFLVITVRIILFPLFVKQIRSQRAMQALAPKMKELQEKYKGDPQTLRMETVKLYQSEKVNPLMGCLPLLLQIPVFFGLFTVLRHLQPGNQPSYGWNQEQFDSAVVARLFNAPIPAHFSAGAQELATLNASGVAVKVVAGLLVLIMMSTTFLTSRQMILKTGWQQDPQQRMIQKLMLYGIPISLLLSGWYFPIGVIIYWVVQNLVSLGQQYWVLHKYPPPATAATGRQSSRETMRSSAVARFFAGEPIRLPAPPGKNGPQRTGLFRRKAAETEAAVTAQQRSLAPRPGAKPQPKARQAPPTAGTGGAKAGGADGSVNGAGGPAPTAASPDGAQAADAEQSGGTRQPGNQRTTGKKTTAAKAGGQRTGGQRSGGQRKGAGSRKGSKKGGSRR
ncbi:MAG TPA: membrane protein insertase YidC [Micromonosporaceae bacterium]|nr:membrane protein insertase YidC [Micromonosporaceae bacterium]